MTTTHAIDPRLNATYHNVFKELAKDRYRTYSVAEFYCDGNKIPDPNKVNVIVRIDVDFGFHLSVPLAKALAHYGINSTHYFLTHPERYYNPWGSGIPAQIHQLGQEVGLHSDHYYGQLVDGDDGLSRLKADVTRLSAETGAPIRGMVYHGHTKIDAMKKTNWELTRNLDSAELGLEYHDNLNGVYIKPGATFWQPDCDIRVSDWLGFSNSWGWNYMPSYPLRFLRQAQPGQIVHLAFHTHNAFEYWRDWRPEYGEPFKAKESALAFWRKAIAIWRRKQLRPKERTISLASNLLGLFGAQILGRLWKRPKQSEPDTSWETARQRIFGRGINYWHGILEDFGVLAPGGRVLEVGSGNGQWLLAFAQDAEAVFGIEPGQAIREYSQQKILEFPEQASRITISPGAAENIRYPSESMDCVLCMEVFMFTKQEQALSEMVRVLKPGGKLFMGVNGLGYYWMYVLNGLRYKSTAKMRFGLRGLFASWLKWMGMGQVGSTCVTHNEMKVMFNRHGLDLIQSRLWLPQDYYPLEHLGFPTNYGFVAVKRNIE